MECRDAQFYLRFRRPGSDELGPEVAGDLDRHLAGCEHCAAEATTASAFDTAVATAMQDVPVPVSLRNKLVAHVAEKRGTDLRRKAYRYAGTAAAVFLALGLTFGLFAGRPNFSVYADLGQPRDDQLQNPSAAVSQWLAAQNLAALPEPFDPTLFDNADYHRIHERYVPCIRFRERHGSGWAEVYVLRRNGPFRLTDLRDFQGSNCQARVYDDEQKFRDVVFVVVHTGPDLRPFLVTGRVNGNGGID
jgi:hypothetical protein